VHTIIYFEHIIVATKISLIHPAKFRRHLIVVYVLAHSNEKKYDAAKLESEKFILNINFC